MSLWCHCINSVSHLDCHIHVCLSSAAYILPQLPDVRVSLPGLCTVCAWDQRHSVRLQVVHQSCRCNPFHCIAHQPLVSKSIVAGVLHVQSYSFGSQYLFSPALSLFSSCKCCLQLTNGLLAGIYGNLNNSYDLRFCPWTGLCCMVYCHKSWRLYFCLGWGLDNLLCLIVGHLTWSCCTLLSSWECRWRRWQWTGRRLKVEIAHFTASSLHVPD